jgi:hypothetical protein
MTKTFGSPLAVIQDADKEDISFYHAFLIYEET